MCVQYVVCVRHVHVMKNGNDFFPNLLRALLVFNTCSGPHVECPNQPNSTTINYYVQPGDERQFLRNPYGDE